VVVTWARSFTREYCVPQVTTAMRELASIFAVGILLTACAHAGSRPQASRHPSPSGRLDPRIASGGRQLATKYCVIDYSPDKEADARRLAVFIDTSLDSMLAELSSTETSLAEGLACTVFQVSAPVAGIATENLALSITPNTGREIQVYVLAQSSYGPTARTMIGASKDDEYQFKIVGHELSTVLFERLHATRARAGSSTTRRHGSSRGARSTSDSCTPRGTTESCSATTWLACSRTGKRRDSRGTRSTCETTISAAPCGPSDDDRARFAGIAAACAQDLRIGFASCPGTPLEENRVCFAVCFEANEQAAAKATSSPVYQPAAQDYARFAAAAAACATLRPEQVARGNPCPQAPARDAAVCREICFGAAFAAVTARP
jgi:hypothetical protein